MVVVPQWCPRCSNFQNPAKSKNLNSNLEPGSFHPKQTNFSLIQPWWLGVFIRQCSHSVDRWNSAHGGSNPIQVWCINRSEIEIGLQDGGPLRWTIGWDVRKS